VGRQIWRRWGRIMGGGGWGLEYGEREREREREREALARMEDGGRRMYKAGLMKILDKGAGSISSARVLVFEPIVPILYVLFLSRSDTCNRHIGPRLWPKNKLFFEY
jgi:hypothetical protein